MTTVIFIGIAYILAGIHYVMRDMHQPIHNRPGYVRNGRLWARAMVVPLWLPFTFTVVWRYGRYSGWRGVMKYLRTEALTSWCLFAFLAYLGVIIS
jgi:hypothetical protein